MDRHRAVLVVIAALLVVPATVLASRETLPLRSVEAWEAAHPDPGPLDDWQQRLAGVRVAADRRQDVLLVLAALASGCLAVAARPRLAQECGGLMLAIMTAGSVVCGVALCVRAASTLGGMAEDGKWSLSDDVLDLAAGEHAPRLRELREAIGEDDAVILLGEGSQLWNVVQWALHPRAIYPRRVRIDATTTDDEIAAAMRHSEIGAAHHRRWVIDLDALRDPSGVAHSDCVRADP